MSYVDDVPSLVRSIYAKNVFMNDFFNIKIDQIENGRAVVSVKIEKEKHLNHRGVVHGAVMTALADSVLGVTCASIGKKVATLSFNMNFIRNTSVGKTARVESSIKHSGRSTIVVEAKMYDSDEKLMATILATMFVVGTFDRIPEKW